MITKHQPSGVLSKSWGHSHTGAASQVALLVLAHHVGGGRWLQADILAGLHWGR